MNDTFSQSWMANLKIMFQFMITLWKGTNSCVKSIYLHNKKDALFIRALFNVFTKTI